MNEKICLHAITTYYELYYTKINIDKLKCILKDNAVLSRRKQGIHNSQGFNGIDYISLCDYQKRNLHPLNYPYYTSYEAYIKKSISLIFPKDKLEILTPHIVGMISPSKKGYANMAYLGMDKETRYSDLYDEVQVANKIPLDLMCGITVPINRMNYSSLLNTNQKIKIIIKHLNKIKELLIKYNHLVPIYDIETMEEINNDEAVKRLIKKYTKKI